MKNLTRRFLTEREISKNPVLVMVFLCILLMFVLEGFTQTIPRIPNCADSPLKPIAGKLYNYSVSVAAPYTTPQTFDWYVTDNPNFMTGSILITTDIIPNTKTIIDAGTGYHDPSTGTNSIAIKWSGVAVTNAKTKPYYLVIKYKGTNGILCEAMNLKAYKIEPRSMFTIDLTNMNGSTDLGLNGSGVAVVNQVCASDILSVSFDGTKMLYNYGINHLLFKIVAANFTGGWNPSLKVDGLMPGQSIQSIEWSETTTFNGTNSFANNADIWTSGKKVAAPADNLTEDGEIIFIRVSIDNGIFEGLTDTPITISANGLTDDNQQDIHYSDCSEDGFVNDKSTQILLSRPAIVSNTGTPVLPFIP